MTSSSPVDSSAGELLRERDRVVDRLRSMALDDVPDDAVRRAAQRLEDLAAALRGEPSRPVPKLASYAAADQVTVLVGELGAAPADISSAATAVLAELRAALSQPPLTDQ
ncbi:MAG: hypothetical protein ACJ71T_01815 [Actinomycetales bacterium]